MPPSARLSERGAAVFRLATVAIAGSSTALVLVSVVASGFTNAPLQVYRSTADLDAAAACCGLDWTKYVETDPRYFRPTEVDYLLGDSSKAREKLGWKPRVNFEELVRMMMAHDLELAKQEVTLAAAGHKVFQRGVSHA